MINQTIKIDFKMKLYHTAIKSAYITFQYIIKY